jgi:hypothetical protein
MPEGRERRQGTGREEEGLRVRESGRDRAQEHARGRESCEGGRKGRRETQKEIETWRKRYKRQIMRICRFNMM